VSAPNFLDSVRVLDLSRILAGPLASQILGDMGAEVLKIEHPVAGDDTRGWGPPFQGDQAAYYQSCNRNKVSLALDLKSESGRAELLRLVAAADLCIDNFTPDLRQRLGVDAKSLRAHNPDLITVSIATFPDGSGRESERGYDLALQAESGWIALNGDPDPEAGGYKVGVAVLDILTGMMASNGALAALFHRERTGEAQCVAVSLFQTALFSLVNVAMNHLVSGEPTRRWGNAHPNIVPYRDFPCRDRAVVIGVGNARQYAELHSILGLSAESLEWDNTTRMQHRSELCEEIAERTRERGSDELLEKLKSAGIPCSAILRVDEALSRVPGSVVAIENEVLGPVKTLASPIVAPGMRSEHRPPPALDAGGRELADRWLGEKRGASAW